MVIHKRVKKLVRNRNNLPTDVDNVTEQKNIKLLPVSSPSSMANANNGNGNANISCFEELTTNRLDKLEELFGNVIQRLDKISNKMGNAN